MDPQVLADNLYRLILITALVILVMLLINNFAFYRRKIKDDISLMLIFGIITTVFEILWDNFEGQPNLLPLTYISAIGYTLFLMVFSCIFARFFLKFFGCYPKKKWVLFLLFFLPNIVFFVLSVTTPWTGLLFHADTTPGKEGFLVEGVLFNSLFVILALSYFIIGLVVATYKGIKTKDKSSKSKKILFTLIGFDVLIPLLLLLQIIIINYEGYYTALSLALALAMMFFISNMNTILLVDSETKMKVMEADLAIASKIQESALPPSKPDFGDNKFKVALRASMKTAREVGGDFYDYFPIDDHRICFLIADVSGKGIPASLFMMTAKTVIKDHASIYDNTSKIFSLVNSRLFEGNKETMFATAWIAILDTNTLTLQYTNAGHNPPLIYRKSEGVQCLKKVDGLILGLMNGIPYSSNTIQLASGDRILLYTDGITEAHNVANELYGEDRLNKVFMDNIDKTEDETIDAILKDIERFSKGAPQFDDITMMVLTIK